jgi:hypothetical protein
VIGSLYGPIIEEDVVIAPTVPDTLIFGVVVVVVFQVGKDAIGLNFVGP